MGRRIDPSWWLFSFQPVLRICCNIRCMYYNVCEVGYGRVNSSIGKISTSSGGRLVLNNITVIKNELKYSTIIGPHTAHRQGLITYGTCIMVPLFILTLYTPVMDPHNPFYFILFFLFFIFLFFLFICFGGGQ